MSSLRWLIISLSWLSSAPTFGVYLCAPSMDRGVASVRISYIYFSHSVVSTLCSYCPLFLQCRHSVGNTKVPFCMQSCVKPLEYAIAVHELGSEHVHRFVGKEPSGFKFNKLSLNEEGKCIKAPVFLCALTFQCYAAHLLGSN